VAAREWRRWVRVYDYREAVEQAEKLADKFVEIRALTLFRYVFDGKGGKDWDAAEAVAYRFVRGDELEHAYALRDYLVEL
jgi:hypothetical protein